MRWPLALASGAHPHQGNGSLAAVIDATISTSDDGDSHRLPGARWVRGYHRPMVSQRAIFVDAGFLLGVGGTQVVGTSPRSAFRVDFEKLIQGIMKCT